MNKALAVIAIIGLLSGCAGESVHKDDNTPKSGGSSIRFGGGDGSSIENAITLIGANSEMAGIGGESLWAQQYLPGWQKTNQELISNGRKNYDGITYRSPDGKTRTIYFDISNFFGKF